MLSDLPGLKHVPFLRHQVKVIEKIIVRVVVPQNSRCVTGGCPNIYKFIIARNYYIAVDINVSTSAASVCAHSRIYCVCVLSISAVIIYL